MIETRTDAKVLIEKPKTLRDEIAIAAMSGILSSKLMMAIKDGKNIAQASYELADEMLAERAK